MKSVSAPCPRPYWRFSKPRRIVSFLRFVRHYLPRWCRSFFQRSTYYFLRLHEIRCYGLEPGYHDARERILYGSFAALVDFVEHDAAWEHQRSESCPGRRSAEDGIAYLDWCAGLKDGPPHQVEAGRVAKELYLWWTVERPARPEIETQAQEDHYDVEDQAKLAELIRIRMDLWT